MPDAELSLSNWTQDLAALAVPPKPADESLPVLFCWAVWFAVSAGLWALIISPFLR